MASMTGVYSFSHSYCEDCIHENICKASADYKEHLKQLGEVIPKDGDNTNLKFVTVKLTATCGQFMEKERRK